MQIKVLKEGTQRPFLLLYVFFSIQLLHRNANAMVRRLFFAIYFSLLSTHHFRKDVDVFLLQFSLFQPLYDFYMTMCLSF